MIPIIPNEDALQCLNLLDYLRDLFTAGAKESYTKTDVLVILDLVRSDPELFDQDAVIAQQIAAQEIEEDGH